MTLIAAVALLGIVAIWMVRGSLASLGGSKELRGLQTTVVVERDDRGIPHIRAGSKADLLRTTGFLHGQDRFFQMDLLRRSAAGELSELFGASALEADRYLRIHRFRAQAQRVVEGMEPGQRELVDLYAEGVNAGLAALRSRPFEYWLLRAKPEPWRPQDSVLVLLAMFLDLQEERAQTDTTREAIRRALPPAMARLLLAEGSPWDAPLVGDPLPTPPLPTREEWESPGLPAPLLDPATALRETGSNAWAIAGSRTADGAAILANDMHLNLRVPNVWYPVRWTWVEAGRDRQAIGVTLPGAPALVIGSNRAVAWGFTNSYVDGVDLVDLVDTDANGYRGANGRVHFAEFEETIEVKGAEAEVLRVRWSEFGPVVSDDPPRAVQWTAHEPGAVNLKLMKMMDVESLEAALLCLQESGIPTQNAVVASADGRVAWTLAGRLPRRGFDGRYPVPSDQPGARWDGFHARERTPSVVDPDDGFLWSANQRSVCCEELELVGNGGYSLAARASQIRDALARMQDADEAQMLRLQLDDEALFLKRWRTLLLHHLGSDPTAFAEAIERIRGDSHHASIGSTGYGPLRRFRLEVHRRLLDAWIGPAEGQPGFDRRYLLPQAEEAVWRAVQEQPLHLLPDPFDSWHALLAEAWSSADSGGSWGERNALSMRHPLSGAVPLLARWLDMPADPVAGDSRMPRVQGPGFGASERFVVSPGGEEVALFHMPGGVSGHPLSPFYRAGHADWVAGRSTRFVGEARYRLELHP